MTDSPSSQHNFENMDDARLKLVSSNSNNNIDNDNDNKDKDTPNYTWYTILITIMSSVFAFAITYANSTAESK